MNFSHILTFMRELLFPAGCAVCNKTLLDAEDAWFGICEDCRETLTIDKDPRCEICGRPLISEIKLCLQCRSHETHHFDRLIALYPYTDKYRKLLMAFKFDKRVCVGNFLAEKLLEGLALLPGEISEIPVLTPVPPRPGKIKHTGFDQIECLARKLQKVKSVSIERLLERLPSKTQKELGGKERLANLLNRIKCRRPPPKEVVLIDDVITTGATMDVCAIALKNAGAERVYGVCLFYD